jgi:preprotein translocase subunit SecD
MAEETRGDFSLSSPLVFCALVSEGEEGTPLPDKSMNGEILYVSRSPALTINDVDSVDSSFDEVGESFAIEITFTQQGAQKNFKFTTENKGKRIAIVSNGEIISAPRISWPSRGKCIIYGSDKSMRQVFERLSKVVHSEKIP